MKTVNTPAGPVKVGDVVNFNWGGDYTSKPHDVIGFTANDSWIVARANGVQNVFRTSLVSSVRMKAGTRVA